MPNRESSNAKIYSRSVTSDNSRVNGNNNDFFDGNGALRVSESETRVLTCGAHYRGGLRRGTACRIWFISASPKNKESSIANATSFLQFRAPFAIHEPDANIRAGCFLDPQGETIATADDAGYLSLFLAKASKSSSNNSFDDTIYDDIDSDEFNDGAECPTLWRSRDKSLLSRRDGFSCLALMTQFKHLGRGYFARFHSHCGLRDWFVYENACVIRRSERARSFYRV